jgi:hypothetical protein
MVEISKIESEKYTPFKHNEQNEFSSKSKKGPKYFVKIDKGKGWSKVLYFV